MFHLHSTMLLLLLVPLVAAAAVSVVHLRGSPSKRLHSSTYSHLSAEPCHADKLTVYKVLLTTHWTRETFPKQYPEFRPHAQWSKVVGRSHNPDYVLWRLGQMATEGVKTFAELGKSDVLDAQSQGEGGIYDEFSAPPIATGAGRTEAEFFVDGNHSRVSLMTRIIPSPDWFVGIDSLNLCEQGNWLDSLVFEVDPIDAGTDNGFTFTAPNWATSPQEKIYRITASHPNHPANSFYYPFLTRLPPLASFKFIKVKEYELSQVFHHHEENVDYTNDVSNVVPIQPDDDAGGGGGTGTTTTTTTTTIRIPTVKTIQRRQQQVATATSTFSGGKFDQSLKSIKKEIRKKRGPRHCRVSEWTEWTACSKTCGIGESTRRRTVVKHPRRGGKACPALNDTKWCGSERSCKGAIGHYFNW